MHIDDDKENAIAIYDDVDNGDGDGKSRVHKFHVGSPGE